MTNAQWERLAPLLPRQRSWTRRPARDHRTVRSAIPWVLRTWASWRDRPDRFGPWSTAWSRLRRWTAAGVWQRVLEDLQRAVDRDRRLHWTTHQVDGTVVRAHQHAAGAAEDAAVRADASRGSSATMATAIRPCAGSSRGGTPAR
jgi:transposase